MLAYQLAHLVHLTLDGSHLALKAGHIRIRLHINRLPVENGGHLLLMTQQHHNNQQEDKPRAGDQRSKIVSNLGLHLLTRPLSLRYRWRQSRHAGSKILKGEGLLPDKLAQFVDLALESGRIGLPYAHLRVVKDFGHLALMAGEDRHDGNRQGDNWDSQGKYIGSKHEQRR